MFFCSKRASLSIRDMSLYFITGFDEGVGRVSEIFELFLELLIGNDVYKLKSEMECLALFVWSLGKLLEIYMQELSFTDFLYLYAS